MKTINLLLNPSTHARGRSWLPAALIASAVLALAALLGVHSSVRVLALLVAALGALALARLPVLRLPVLIIAALMIRPEIGTGTDVKLNVATLLIPVLAVLWLLDMSRQHRVEISPARASLPLLLYLGSSLLSLLIGRATWDPTVPISDNFILVQLAQWAILAFSALAFWLGGSLIKDERRLWGLTATLLVVGGTLALARMLPGVKVLANPITTIAFIRAPFWMLLTALAGGQLLFNQDLSGPRRAFLLATIATSAYYALVAEQEAASNWVGLAAALGVLVWLRFPRMRAVLITLIVIVAATGLLFPAVYDFAGGEEEWRLSGGSRLVLIERVVSVTMRNPITGLGPAAYRPYANKTPLGYGGAYWVSPRVNSHNNYVDLFANEGIVGLFLFFWFAWEIARLGLRVRKRFPHGFTAGYANGMLAVGASSLVIMMLADWILPFVYNTGFPGFQASLLVWLFMGGLVAMDTWGHEDRKTQGGEKGPALHKEMKRHG